MVEDTRETYLSQALVNFLELLHQTPCDLKQWKFILSQF